MSFDEYTSTQKVKAEKIEEGRSVITPNGPLAALPGQWEVRYPDGNVQVVDDEQFQTAFGSGGGDEAEVTPQAEVNPEETETEDTEESEDEAAEPEPAPSKTKAPPKPS